MYGQIMLNIDVIGFGWVMIRMYGHRVLTMRMMMRFSVNGELSIKVATYTITFHSWTQWKHNDDDDEKTMSVSVSVNVIVYVWVKKSETAKLKEAAARVC